MRPPHRLQLPAARQVGGWGFLRLPRWAAAPASGRGGSGCASAPPSLPASLPAPSPCAAASATCQTPPAACHPSSPPPTPAPPGSCAEAGLLAERGGGRRTLRQQQPPGSAALNRAAQLGAACWTGLNQHACVLLCNCIGGFTVCLICQGGRQAQSQPGVVCRIAAAQVREGTCREGVQGRQRLASRGGSKQMEHSELGGLSHGGIVGLESAAGGALRLQPAAASLLRLALGHRIGLCHQRLVLQQGRRRAQGEHAAGKPGCGCSSRRAGSAAAAAARAPAAGGRQTARPCSC